MGENRFSAMVNQLIVWGCIWAAITYPKNLLIMALVAIAIGALWGSWYLIRGAYQYIIVAACEDVVSLATFLKERVSSWAGRVG